MNYLEQILDFLSTDPDVIVRRNVALNDQTSLDTIQRMYKAQICHESFDQLMNREKLGIQMDEMAEAQLLYVLGNRIANGGKYDPLVRARYVNNQGETTREYNV